jgi:hypothetical protein
MTIPSEVDVVVGSADADTGSYVDWPAIIAGIVLASGISLVLLTFGSAIGLSMTDFRAGEGVSPIWIAIAAGSWLLWVQISSFMAGGYLTGRLRKRHGDATEDEVDVRDGAHGLLVWAGALLIGALVAVSGLGAAATAIGSAASTLTTAAANVAGEAADSSADPTAYFVDTLFRPAPVTTEAPATEAPAATTEAPAAGAEAPAATAPPSTPPATPATAPAAATAATTSPDTSAVRAEAARIFAASAVSGEVSTDDRAYLAQVVATNTGLSDEEAGARVDQVMTALDNARTEAAETAEAARKTGVLAAFLTAASLLVSAAGAFWAAQKGGQHRDQGTVFASAFRRF